MLVKQKKHFQLGYKHILLNSKITSHQWNLNLLPGLSCMGIFFFVNLHYKHCEKIVQLLLIKLNSYSPINEQ